MVLKEMFTHRTNAWKGIVKEKMTLKCFTGFLVAKGKK